MYTYIYIYLHFDKDIIHFMDQIVQCLLVLTHNSIFDMLILFPPSCQLIFSRTHQFPLPKCIHYIVPVSSM